jgi:hypothetical protein
MTDREGDLAAVLLLRNLAMIENIRRAEDPAWRERLQRQQVVARLARMFGRAEPQRAWWLMFPPVGSSCRRVCI